MRVKLTFEDPLPPYKCWYEIPASCSTVHDLQKAIRKGFELNKICKTTRLDLDGFFLLPASSIAGSVKEGDLLQVMIRKKNDHLPPRSLPAVGGKRPRDELEPVADPMAKRRRNRRNRNKSKQTAQTSTKQQMEKQLNAGQQPNKSTAGNASAQGNNQNAKKSGSKQNSGDIKEKTPDAKKGTQKQKNDRVSKKSNNSGKTNSVTTSGQAQRGGRSTTKVQAQKKTQEPKKGLNPSSKLTKQTNVTGAVANASKAVPQMVKASADSSSSSSSSDDSDSDSSDSDSSDSSDSDSSSSSSSSDDEDSTHESDTTELSATEAAHDSESDQDGDATGSRTMVPPGAGSLQTKLRNNRRKLQRKKEVLARMDEAIKEGKDIVHTSPDGAASGAGKQKPQSLHQNITAPSPAAVKSSPPKTPKVVMTTIQLEDKDLMSKKRNSMPTQRVTRSSSKGRNTDSAESTAVTTTGKEVEDAQLATTNGQKENTDDFDAPLRDYDGLPKLEALSVEIGNVIGYKTLELGADYNPIISDFKEAKVLKLFQGESSAEVQLARRFRSPVMLDEEGQPVLGKFDIYNEEEFERARRGIVLLDLLSLADCRMVAQK
ncbi:hypothetical protein EC968_002602 [Mortierella alpina]|nr:hypothetical protein EC968_002602 [Mortierella alpina]